MVTIRYKAILPKGMNIAGYANVIRKQLLKEGKEIEKLYTGIHNTWSKPVKYDKKLTATLEEMKIRVSTKDVRLVNLDLGTQTRWAVMSNPFTPKTRRRRLRSVRGQGRVIVRGSSAMRRIGPMKGIKPREFSKEIRDQREPKFERNMRRAMKRAAKGTF